MHMEKKLPQMTESAYIAVREALKRSIPPKVTPTWVMANVPGYSVASAKTLVRYLTTFGLLDTEGAPTETAKLWRMDETYGKACDNMLRHGFPSDIVDAVPKDSPADVVARLFMARGLGEGSAKNLARIYRLISSRMPPEAKKLRPTGGESNTGQSRPDAKPKNSRATKSVSTAGSVSAEVEPGGHDGGIAVLRYFLDRGRMAEVRIPKDMDDRERRRLFAHLRIDLLDEVSE